MTCRVQAGRLYDVRVVVEAEGGLGRDEVTLQYGVRRLDWDGAGARINLQPLYIHGIARHEDAVTRGKVRSIFRAVSRLGCLFRFGSYEFQNSNFDGSLVAKVMMYVFCGRTLV